VCVPHFGGHWFPEPRCPILYVCWVCWRLCLGGTIADCLPQCALNDSIPSTTELYVDLRWTCEIDVEIYAAGNQCLPVCMAVSLLKRMPNQKAPAPNGGVNDAGDCHSEMEIAKMIGEPVRWRGTNRLNFVIYGIEDI
jgi:hypothetical protein